MIDLPPPWPDLIEMGKRSGHVCCRCGACGALQMIAYRPASQPWPKCRVCREAPTLEPLTDPSEILHKRPGRPRTKTQLLRDGGIYRPQARRVSDSSHG